MVTKEDLSSMDNYDKYRALIAISHAIVKNSKGLGFASFDKDTILKDVRRAEEVFAVAKGWWKESELYSKAIEKQRAADLLGIDAEPYEAEFIEHDKLRNVYVELMDKVLSGWHRDYYGKWEENAKP